MKGNSAVIGTYKGKCCDGDVVNSNGMFLSRELFDTLLNSDEYKNAIKNGYYIGFLGHPEDPDCQDFKNGCIVMTSMEMLDNGDIYGEFDLIDTPVGRIVKSFIDAGVNFGISIRGVGDVANDGTVDPDSFVFRGFDLVSFPAYSDCVPEFQAIAASTDAEKKKAYKKVCNVVKREASSITSSTTLDVIKDQFNPNSDEYMELDEMSDNLQNMEEPLTIDEYVEVLEQKVKGLTELYISKVQENKNMYEEMNSLQADLFSSTRINSRTKNIMSSQFNELNSQLSSAENVMSSVKLKNDALKKKVARYKKSSISATKQLEKLKAENRKLVKANEDLEDEVRAEILANKKLNSKVKTIEEVNLRYQSEVEASESLIKEKESSIQSLESELRKTVVANKKISRDTSNREDEIEDLQSRINACEQIILDYQQAYADMCAYSAGVELDNVKISADTTVDELKSIIYGSASSYAASKSSANAAVDFDQLYEDTDDDVIDDIAVL